MRVTIKQLQELVAEARGELSEAQAQPLNPVGDPVSDVLLGEFLEDMATELMHVYEEDPSVSKRLGGIDSYEAQVAEVLGLVESYVRNRLLDLWAGEYSEAVPFNEADYVGE